MPLKPVRFGIKVWAKPADVLPKYLWNFEIYCGKSGNPHDVDNDSNEDNDGRSSSNAEVPRAGIEEDLQGRNVIKSLMQDLVGIGVSHQVYTWCSKGLNG
jgi:hypothetical protein